MDVHHTERCPRRLDSGNPEGDFWRQFVEASSAGFVVSVDGRIAYANEAGACILGRETPKACVGLALTDLVLPAHHPVLQQRLQDLDRGARTLPYEYEVRRADGSTRHVEVTSSSCTFEGQPALQSVVRDVTARKRIQDRARLQADVLDSTAQAVYAADPEGRLVYWNRAAAELFGRAAEEVVGRPLWEWAPPEARQHLRVALQVLRAGQRWSEELRLLRADGTSFPALFTKSARLDEAGTLLGYVGAVTDLSERDRIEKALEASEERLRLALEAARMGTWDLSLPTEDLQLSEQAWQLYGVTPGVVASTSRAFLALLAPQDRRHFLQQLKAALDGGGAFSCRHRVAHPDGTLHWLHSEGRVHFDRDGQPVRFLGTVRDVTRRVRAERALRKAHRRLQQKQARLVHSEKMASLGHLAAGVAHEVNNPMGFILGNLGVLAEYTPTVRALLHATEELLEAQAAADAPGHDAALTRIRTLHEDEDLGFILDDIDELVAETRAGGERVKEIVQSLKSFARTDDTGMTQADVNEGLRTTLRMLQHEFKYKGEVHTRFGPIPAIHCNPGQLNQVFMNLLVNASQAIDERGDITVETTTAEGEVAVRISDTGRGIPPEHLSELFTPFFTTKPVGEGSGLGLSIAYGIVKDHGGRLEVESVAGQGTTFTVYLPLSDAAPEREGDPTSRAA